MCVKEDMEQCMRRVCWHIEGEQWWCSNAVVDKEEMAEGSYVATGNEVTIVPKCDKQY
jgi:hypothetical protein